MKYLAIEGVTPAREVGEVVVLPAPEKPRRRRRRSWTLEQKLAIVREVSETGDPVAVVARRHDMNANHLFTWIERARRGTLDRRRGTRQVEDETVEFLDLGVIGQRADCSEAKAAPPEPARIGGQMEIRLTNGVRIRVTPPIEPVALRLVILAAKEAS